MVNICTIVARNYLPHARVLARSFLGHNPDGSVFVLVIDDSDDSPIDGTGEPFEIVRPADLPLDRRDFLEMASNYDVMELSTAVKPWLLRYLLEDRVKASVVFLDPDVKVYGSLAEIDQLASEYGIVLIPHLTEPLPRDNYHPGEPDLLTAGIFNLGFIAVAPSSQATEVVDWWSERLREDCIVRPKEGYFVDQRWMDLIAGFTDEYKVLRDPGYNVAYWNLHSRELAWDGQGYKVNGSPLRFFHFSGFSPDRPRELSKHQNRFELANREPALQGLFSDYAQDLDSNGFSTMKSIPYRFGKTATGLPITSEMRSLFREGLEIGALSDSLFNEEGEEEFFRWIDEPATHGARAGVNRFLEHLYESRPDLQATYPDLDGPSGAGFMGWAMVHGVREVDIPKRVLPPPSAATGGKRRWRRRRSLAPIDPEAQPSELYAPTARHDYRLECPWGVNVAGYFSSELGVGEVARQMMRGLDAAKTPTMPVHPREIPLSRQGHEYFHVDTDKAPFLINLICVNADGLPKFAKDAGRQFFDGRYNIGIWWWEAEKFPERWSPSFDYLDELWVATEFIQEAVSKESPIPVHRVRLPVSTPNVSPHTRAELEFPSNFVFLVMFDFHSVFERKNPLAAIDAFARAFEPGSGASLVIKAINGEYYPDKVRKLRQAVATRPDVHLIDRYVSPQEKDAMVANCDCFVSLHRSEGFGLGPAEAMLLGKPVIATGYSGNLDYMSEEDSYPVDWTKTKIGPGCEPYPSDSHWAEPDVDHAAKLMRQIVDDPSEAERRGRRAAARLQKSHSPEAAAKTLQVHLGRIRNQIASELAHAGRGFEHEPVSVDDLRTKMLRSIDPQRGTEPGGVRGFFRRTLLRLMRPYSSYQREIMLDLLRGIEGGFSRDLVDVKALPVDAGLVAAMRIEHERITSLSATARDVERLLTEMRQRPHGSGGLFETFVDPNAGRVLGYRPDTADAVAGPLDSYRSFEDIFRGSEEMIRDRQRIYLDLVGDRQPVIDLGCGRGEFIGLLRDRNVAHVGVDVDPEMIEHCRKGGLENVVLDDANKFLERQDDGSLGVIFCAQVIQQLPFDYLRELIALSTRKLKPDGLFIAETVNPHSVQAMKTFWVDLTHRHPIFPEAALTLCRIAGFPSAFLFHPNGTGDPERDSANEGEYAIVASAPGVAGQAGIAAARRGDADLRVV